MRALIQGSISFKDNLSRAETMSHLEKISFIQRNGHLIKEASDSSMILLSRGEYTINEGELDELITQSIGMNLALAELESDNLVSYEYDDSSVTTLNEWAEENSLNLPEGASESETEHWKNEVRNSFLDKA